MHVSGEDAVNEVLLTEPIYMSIQEYYPKRIPTQLNIQYSVEGEKVHMREKDNNKPVDLQKVVTTLQSCDNLFL